MSKTSNLRFGKCCCRTNSGGRELDRSASLFRASVWTEARGFKRVGRMRRPVSEEENSKSLR